MLPHPRLDSPSAPAARHTSGKENARRPRTYRPHRRLYHGVYTRHVAISTTARVWEASIWLKVDDNSASTRSGHQFHVAAFEKPEDAAVAVDCAALLTRGVTINATDPSYVAKLNALLPATTDALKAALTKDDKLRDVLAKLATRYVAHGDTRALEPASSQASLPVAPTAQCRRPRSRLRKAAVAPRLEAQGCAPAHAEKPLAWLERVIDWV